MAKTEAAAGSVSLIDLPVPRPEAGEVLIEVHAAGICGTDLHIYNNEYRHKVPVVLGHEFSGVITETGAGVTSFREGERVVSLTAAKTCGECDYCSDGLPMLCEQRLSLGSGVNGAFARYLTVDARLLLRVPDAVDLTAAALTEPLACAANGVLDAAGVTAGDVVVVSGPGAIGLLAAQVAKAAGGTVVVCGAGRDRERLDLAGRLGADRAVNITEEDPGEIVSSLSGGYGADVVMECAGTEASAASCLRLARKRGRYLQLGLFGKRVSLELDLVVYKEIRLASIFGTTRRAWKRALGLLAGGHVQTLPLVTAKLPLRGWKAGFTSLEEKTGLKTLLFPDQD